MEASRQLKHAHFVLVHGSCHGAWCWYKLKPRLESSSGHRVTALDLSASGLNRKTLDEVFTFQDYSAPLMEFMASIPIDEKVILVGHSFGGMTIALAMEKYPEKISVAVFVTAWMPDTKHRPSYILEQLTERATVKSLDNQVSSFGSTEKPLTWWMFGPQFLATYLYQLCSIDDLSLALMLARPSSQFPEDLEKASKFSDEGYGSVKRVYIVCNEDKSMTKDLQCWMIGNSGANETKEIDGADHMAMFSKPEELCRCLLDIALKYT